MSYTTNDYRPGSGSSRYVPDEYSSPNTSSYTDGDRLAPQAPRPATSPDRPYTPPNPEQYNASPSYRVPLDSRPANPDVQAIQAAEGYGAGRPRSSSSRSQAPSHVSHHSQRSHHSHHDRRPSHESVYSHRSHHSTAGRSHHSPARRRSGEEMYRTESEREDYIQRLKRASTKRPTLGGSMISMWDNIKKSLVK